MRESILLRKVAGVFTAVRRGFGMRLVSGPQVDGISPALPLALALALLPVLIVLALLLAFVLPHGLAGLSLATPLAVAAPMRRTLKQLQDRKAQLVKDMRAMLDGAADANLSAEDTEKFNGLEAELTRVNEALAREQRLQEVERTMAAAPSATPATPQITDVHNREGDRPWASLGEQLQAVVQAGLPTGMTFAGLRGGEVDPRLYGAASGASATVGSDGGFLIRKDFAVDLLTSAFKSGDLTSRCSQTEISENSDGLEVPYLDETSRANGSRWGGIQVYRVAEADTVTASKPQLGKWECRLEDMMGLAYLTERLAQDAGAMAQVFSEGFNAEFAFKADDEVYRGNGAGQCLGLLNHIWSSSAGTGSVVSVAKESGQTADTIVAENVINMWAKVLPRAKANGVWFVNTECMPELQKMQIGTGASGTLVYMPPGGLTGASFGTIYGRPVIEIEQASALGDVGDIMFADLSFYKLIRKGGIKQDESIHVRFLYNERAIRWVSRFNGAPKLKAAITPYKGASGSKLSPFVTLAAR